LRTIPQLARSPLYVDAPATLNSTYLWALPSPP
jgi:hypothetical protein